MTYFIKDGPCYHVLNHKSVDLSENLPPTTYVVKYSKQDQFFLEVVESFTLPKKLYGNTTRHTDRIFNTFQNRDISTGVLLVGEKGSGKTLLSKSISVLCKNNDIPTLIINQPFHGDQFNTFIQTINQPCMILFDEFEKVYKRDEQEQILTLLDGVYPSSKLFVLTCNNPHLVDINMKNRPGRIYYMIEFNGLEEEFIREYAEDNLINKEHIDQLCRICKVFSNINFDMLKALVEEMNRYNESPNQAIELLNTKPEFEPDAIHQVEITFNNKPVNLSRAIQWTGNPMSPGNIEFYINFEDRVESAVTAEKHDTNPDGDTWVNFDIHDLKSFDANTNKFIYVNAENYQLTLTKLVLPNHYHPLAI